CLDDLAGLGALGDHDTRGICQEVCVPELFLGRVQLGHCRLHLRLGGAEGPLRVIVLDVGGPALAHQRPLAFVVVGRFSESCRGSGDPGLCGAQRVALQLRVEFGDKVVRLHLVPHIDAAREHSAIDAERKAFLGARPNVAGERYLFSLRDGRGDDGADRPDFGGRRRRFVARGQEGQAQSGESGGRFHSTSPCSHGEEYPVTYARGYWQDLRAVPVSRSATPGTQYPPGSGQDWHLAALTKIIFGAFGLRQHGAELRLRYFLERRALELLQHPHFAGQFETREGFRARVQDTRGQVQISRILREDERDGHLVEQGIGAADHRHFAHTLDTDDDALDLRG